jgi:hypothetical protein
LQVRSHIEKIWGYAWVFSLPIVESEFQKRQQEWRVITIEETQEFARVNTHKYKWVLPNTPIELLSRRSAMKDAKSISEAITTIMNLRTKE